MPTEPAVPTDWETRPLPERRTTIALDRAFSPNDMDRVRTGLIPEVMEDKWFIYWRDEALYFHRSWTGFCIYIVRFATHGEGSRMVRAEVNRDPAQYQLTDDEHDALMIPYLIDTLLLRRPATYPSGDDASGPSVLGQWANIGRTMLGRHPGDDDDADA